MKTVTSVEQAKAVLVARAVNFGANDDNDEVMEGIQNVIEEIGLGDHLRPETSYAVSTSALLEAIGETFSITVKSHQSRSLREGTLRAGMRGIVSQWIHQLDEGDWTLSERSETQVDVDACVRDYGASGKLPPVDPSIADEVRALWQDLINKALDWAGDYEKTCETFEGVVIDIGFDEFLPPAKIAIDVVWQGIPLGRFTVKTDRKGLPRLDSLQHAVRARLVDLISHLEQGDDGDLSYTVVTGEPVPDETIITMIW